MRLADRLGWYELIPVRQDASGDEIRPTAGLVFVPGARIDSRAYANVLRPLAEAGYLVAVLKEPFGFSFLDADHGKKVLDVHPEITDWAVVVTPSVAAPPPHLPTRTNGSRAWCSSPPTRGTGWSVTI